VKVLYNNSEQLKCNCSGSFGPNVQLGLAKTLSVSCRKSLLLQLKFKYIWLGHCGSDIRIKRRLVSLQNAILFWRRFLQTKKWVRIQFNIILKCLYIDWDNFEPEIWKERGAGKMELLLPNFVQCSLKLFFFSVYLVFYINLCDVRSAYLCAE